MQKNFLKFLNRKKNKRKQMKRLKKKSAKKRRSPEFIEELRKKFV